MGEERLDEEAIIYCFKDKIFIEKAAKKNSAIICYCANDKDVAGKSYFVAYLL